jgi:hypothetical protein
MGTVVIGEYISKTNLSAEERIILHYFVTALPETTTPNKHHKITLDPFLAEIAIAIMLLNDFFPFPVLVPLVLKNMQTYYA